MTLSVVRPEPATPATEFEAATTTSDDLRATVRVSGRLSAGSAPLLIGVLEAHRRAGRRYLRVDLAECELDGPGALEALRGEHTALAASGGMLVFDHADPAAAALLQRGDLFVTATP